MSALSLVHAIVCRNRDASWAPCAVVSASRTNDALLLTSQSGIILVVVMLCISSLSKDLADQPTSADVFTIHNTTISQLDALSCPVYPGKVKVEEGLDDAERKADGENGAVIGFGGAADDPVEDIKGAVRTKSREIEAVDDGGDRCLAEEEQLWQDAERLEDERKRIGNLMYSLARPSKSVL